MGLKKRFPSTPGFLTLALARKPKKATDPVPRAASEAHPVAAAGAAGGFAAWHLCGGQRGAEGLLGGGPTVGLALKGRKQPLSNYSVWVVIPG